MDHRQFDRLTRALSAAGTRRGLLGLLLALSGLGSVVDAVAARDVAKAGRRKRRKKRHKRRKGRGRHKAKDWKQRCRSASRATTCAGRCGLVENNCQKPVDCGSCACDPPCGACLTCQEAPNTPGVCVPDPAQEEEVCGPGQFCRADGACACEADSCAACETCQGDGVCSLPCGGEGCCAAGDCLGGDTIEACGVNGEHCQVCAEDELCWNGRCVCGDVCADGCQFSTLWEAVGVVEPGATLRLCAETYSSISILKDLTLVGVGDGEDGTVLHGQGRATVVNVGPDVTTAVLRGLRITGGAATVVVLNGGGIRTGGGTLKLIDCTVTGNVAGNTGGGIYGGDAILINTRVTNNHAGIKAGGIAGGNYVLQDSVVSGNTTGFRGAGIFADGPTELINTDVTDNVAEKGEGGGILNWSMLTLTEHCKVSDNTAGTTGGGIHNNGGDLTLERSQVTDNVAAEGGGIYFRLYPNAGSVTLTESTVEDNQPDNCAGEPIAGCSG